MPLDLSSLNEAQREAVTATEGPCMVVAGPGAGKTRVLTYRIAHLIDQGLAPLYRILALTFTNKAANEMRQRLGRVLETELRGGWIGTFHSLFAKVLRIECAHLGYVPHFTIYDRDDSLALIKRLVKQLQLDEDRYKASVVLGRISHAKSYLVDAEAYVANGEYAQEDRERRRERMGELFTQYTLACRQAEALDFDDLLLATYKLFRDYPEVLEKYQERFRYVLVDEFQDTNGVQYALLKLLVAKHRNLCIIGDDAQSIYAFRGADVGNMLGFEKEFAGAKRILLTQNYRSTPEIVAAADALIKGNRGQLHKDLFTANQKGQRIGYAAVASCGAEARFVAQRIFMTAQHEQASYNGFAILYRTNSQSRLFEEALRGYGIPYKLVGGTAFYQRKEVKDLLAYLRLVVNTRDEQALRRVINLPKRGIGLTTMAKVTGWAMEKGVSLWEVLTEIRTYMQAHNTVATIERFVALVEVARGRMAAGKDAYEMAMGVAEASGLVKVLYADRTPEGVSRYENVQELLDGIKAFATSKEEGKEVTLPAFLEEVALMTGEEEVAEGATPRVQLMTVHAAKGLEFPHVYIVGMEEGVFPMGRKPLVEVDEERRLFYVALTRAQKTVCLTYAASRVHYGKVNTLPPSRFLKELPSHCLVSLVGKQGGSGPKAPYRASSGYGKPLRRRQMTKVLPQQRVDTNALVVGSWVQHASFGQGKIIAVADHGANQVITTIVFDLVGVKKIVPKFANMAVIDPVR